MLRKAVNRWICLLSSLLSHLTAIMPFRKRWLSRSAAKCLYYGGWSAEIWYSSRGEAFAYPRFPSFPNDYAEKIWDHAAGIIIVEETAGRITDMHGHALDFSQGPPEDIRRMQR